MHLDGRIEKLFPGDRVEKVLPSQRVIRRPSEKGGSNATVL